MSSKNNRPATADEVHLLDRLRNKVTSKTGGWIPGKGVYCHGYSMLEDLVGKKSYFQILILNATGRLVERPLADWVEAGFGCLSWPDPRIWCNQIGALAGSARTSVVAATSMGALATDSRLYGAYPLIEGVRFIQNALQQHKAGATPQEIVDQADTARGGKPHIMGYIRPIARGDERLRVMQQVSRDLQFQDGEHLTLAYAIEKVLLDKFGESMNINGYASAFLADREFSAEEVYRMCTTLVTSGVTACYLETLAQPEGTFLPLRCDDIDYRGKPEREVPLAPHTTLA